MFRDKSFQIFGLQEFLLTSPVTVSKISHTFGLLVELGSTHSSAMFMHCRTWSVYVSVDVSFDSFSNTFLHLAST